MLLVPTKRQYRKPVPQLRALVNLLPPLSRADGAALIPSASKRARQWYRIALDSSDTFVRLSKHPSTALFRFGLPLRFAHRQFT